MTLWPDDDVILYDGVCVFCSRWVRFVATRDAAHRFRFTAIQSPYGTRLAQAFGIDPDDPDTNAVDPWRRGVFQVRCRADGAGYVCRDGDGCACSSGAKAAARCGLQPRRTNRYRIFGKYDECFVPDAEMRARVME